MGITETTLTLLYVVPFFYATVTDIKRREIPNLCSLMLIFTGIFHILFANISLADALLTFFVIGAVLLIIAIKTNGIGGGDVKLCATASISVGFTSTLYAMFIACLVASIFFTLKKSEKKASICFAPFLSIGFLAVYFI